MISNGWVAPPILPRQHDGNTPIIFLSKSGIVFNHFFQSRITPAFLCVTICSDLVELLTIV